MPIEANDRIDEVSYTTIFLDPFSLKIYDPERTSAKFASRGSVIMFGLDKVSDGSPVRKCFQIYVIVINKDKRNY